MIIVDQLNNSFGIKDEVRFAKSDNNLIYLQVSNKHSEATIYLYGAHVTSFKPRLSNEILWMSPLSSFEMGKPIRGGIPVCFPWFGPHKSDSEKPQHGFGRLMNWEVTETATCNSGETVIVFQLCSDEKTKIYWPHNFCAQLTVVVGQMLEVKLKVTNLSVNPFEYTCALHSYYRVSSVSDITISGLQGASYHSQLELGDFVQDLPQIRIQKAETRHYHHTEATCILEDAMQNRKIWVAKAGSKITTVWNPGKETCATIPDMPDDAYLNFVCIEAVNAFDNIIMLNSGESHTTSAMISLEE